MNKTEHSFKITYIGTDGRCKYKTVRALTRRGAMMKFKKLTGFKAIAAEQVWTAAEKREYKKAKTKGRKTYFDGRTMCYFDDTLVDGPCDGTH